jgi:hypothetical protein
MAISDFTHSHVIPRATDSRSSKIICALRFFAPALAALLSVLSQRLGTADLDVNDIG